MTLTAPTLSPEPVETYPETYPETRPKTPREVGEHAARYIEEHGWCQATDDDDGSDAVCAALAISYAAADGRLDYAARRALAHYLGLPDSTRAVYSWNDAPERTEAEVLAALRSIR